MKPFENMTEEDWNSEIAEFVSMVLSLLSMLVIYYIFSPLIFHNPNSLTALFFADLLLVICLIIFCCNAHGSKFFLFPGAYFYYQRRIKENQS